MSGEERVYIYNVAACADAAEKMFGHVSVGIQRYVVQTYKLDADIFAVESRPAAAATSVISFR